MTNVTRTRSMTSAKPLAFGGRSFVQISDSFGKIGEGTFPAGVHNHLWVGGTSESISDTLSTQKPWPGNPVKHTKVRWDPINHVSGYSVRAIAGDYRCPFTATYTASLGLWGSYGHLWQFPTDSQFTASWNSTDRDLQFEALEQFYNSNIIESAVNAIEAGQTAELARSIWSVNAHKLRQFCRKSRKARAKIAASSYLGYEFGIAPLVRDFSSMKAEIGKIQSQCNAAIDRLGKPVRFSSYDNKGTITFGDVTGPKQSWNGTYSQYRLFQKPAVKRCVVSGRVLSSGSVLVDKFNYYMKRYGSDNAISMMWETAPYSFMVDWVVDLKLLFAQVDNFLTGSRYKVDRITMSEKLDWSVDMMLNRVGDVYSLSPPNGSVIARGQYSRYTRSPVPEPHGIRTSGLFGKKQFALTCALLAQKIF